MQKITISTTGKRISVDVNDVKADKAFWSLAERLMLFTKEQELEPVKPKTEEPVLQQFEELEDPEEELELEDPEEELELERRGYTGFLLIECEHCGKIKGFCSKSAITYYRCDCGGKTELEDLRRLYVNCECGRRSAYFTNVKDAALDVNCIDCGQPVAVQWNSKKKIYETTR